MITIKSKKEIDILRKGGRILAGILDALSKKVKEGVSASMLEDEARALIKEHGGKPAFLNYTPRGAKRAYPAALCLSINEEVVHGIPNEKPRILKNGDLVTLDCGIQYEGLFTDSAITIPCGKVDARGQRLIDATNRALRQAIDAAKPGARTGDIGEAVEKVARAEKFSLAEDLGGHGVGYAPHEDPFIPNFGDKGHGPVLKEGMVLAIEPMLCEGTGKTKMLSDGYTYVTEDGKRSAHAEHTVVITKDGAEILTSL